MFASRLDLPLADDPTTRFLPWLVALMVFMSAIMVASVFILSGVISRWDHDVSGTVTVQVATAPGTAVDAEVRTNERVDAAIALLRKVPGVVNVRALDRAELVGLMEPWLGDATLIRDLPLPRLIDVTVDADHAPDLARLSKDLTQAVPGVSLEDHRVWLGRLIGLSRAIQWLAIAIVVLIGAVTSVTVVYATRTGMAVHQEVIEVMHLIGARDDYIARQFALHAFRMGLRGGLLGLALAVPTLVALSRSTGSLQVGFLPDLSLSFLGWLTVAMVPLIAALLAMASARVTVHGTIARMP